MHKFGILDYTNNADIERQIIGSLGEVIQFNAKNEDDLPNGIEELDGAMVWHYINVSQKTLDKLKKCKVLVRIGVGYDSVDFRYAGSIGLPIVNIPDYGTNDVADHAFSLLLTVCRRITVYNDALMAEPVLNWTPEIGRNIHRFTGRTMGIVGMGRIGTAMAQRAKSFGMNVAFYDPYLPDGYDKTYQVNCIDNLNELFKISDYISVHIPANEETKGLINEEIIRSSKPGLTLINTARGAVVSLDAVYNGLKDGLLDNFAADVLENEPPNKEHKLIKAYSNKEDWLYGRMVLTPHSAFYAMESEHEMRVKAAKQMLNAVQNIPLRNCINAEFLVNQRTSVAGK